MYPASYVFVSKSMVETWYLLYGSYVDCNQIVKNFSERQTDDVTKAEKEVNDKDANNNEKEQKHDNRFKALPA